MVQDVNLPDGLLIDWWSCSCLQLASKVSTSPYLDPEVFLWEIFSA